MKNIFLLLLPFAVLTSVAKGETIDWSNKHGVGGYVSWSHYPVNDQQVELRTQGLTYAYGLKPRLRLGGNLGVFISNRGGETGGTVTGFSIAPSASWDLVQKSGGVLYVVGRTMAYDLVRNSGSTPDDWNLDLFNAGVGIEAVVSRDVGIALEGDVLRFGITRAADKSETHVGALAFPSVRLLARLYF